VDPFALSIRKSTLLDNVTLTVERFDELRLFIVFMARPQNLWAKTFDTAPLQRVGFFALLKKQADMLERSQGLPKQPLACFLTPAALELVPTSALSSTEAT
jgi:hypothetical protein